MTTLYWVLGVALAGLILTHVIIPFVFLRIGRALGFKLRLTPMMARRVARFKTIRRGYFSFILITTVFVISLFLELLVNNKPLLIRYGDNWACPAVAEWGDVYLPFLGLSPYQRASDFGLGVEGPTGAARVKYRKFQSFCENPDLLLADIARQRESVERRQAAMATARPPRPPKQPVAPKKPGPDATDDEKEDYEFALDDYKDALKYFEKDQAKYTAALAEFEKGKKALAADVRDLEKLKANHAGFKNGKARIWMPLYPYHPDEKLLEQITRCDAGQGRILGYLIPGCDNSDGKVCKAPHRPSVAHPLGTTDNATDVLCQLAYGFRIAMVFALIVASVGYTIGIIVGGAMGYYGSWFDIFAQRFVEIWGSIPFLFVMMIMAGLMNPNVIMLAVMLIILRSWMGITYTIRGEFYREKAKDYVSAATAMGVSDWKIMTRHILPNSLVPVVSFAPFGIVAYVSVLVSLDYLGFGLPPGTPSWGYLLQQGREHIIHYRHLIVVPSLAVACTLFCVVMIGEAVREGFDPKVFSRLR